MHILITTDTIGGVWTYTRELVTGLVRRAVDVTLVSFGNIPTAEQVRWMEGLPRLDYRPTGFRLEWMQDSEQDLALSAAYLQAVVREVKPDLLHLNQFYYGALETSLPKVVVAHSDVVGWWRAVHQEEPKDSAWIRWYRLAVYRGLANATRVVAPSQTMLTALGDNFLHLRDAQVIHNGRDPRSFHTHMSKERYAVSVGRLWDPGKNAQLLAKAAPPLTVYIAGESQHPEHDDGNLVTSSVQTGGGRVTFTGPQDEHELRRLLARARIYVATSRYEPFGLAPVEAALSKCALLLSDIPSFRELWEEDAIYFRSNDVLSLRDRLSELADDPQLAQQYGERAHRRALERFTAEAMVTGYVDVYRSLVPAEALVA